MKRCGSCGNEKALDDFRLMRETRTLTPSSYPCSVCKACEKARALANYHKNKERCQESNKKYKEQNKDKINATRRKYIANKINTSPEERLKRNMKSLISAKLVKTRHTGEYLGAPMQLIARWIESNFEKEMSWENYGKYWQIDHTIPINLFNLSDEQEAMLCFSWMNLMPLEKSRNASKSDNLELDRIAYQEQQLKSFAEAENITSAVHTFLQKYSTKLGYLLCMQHDQIAGTSLEPLLPLPEGNLGEEPG